MAILAFVGGALGALYIPMGMARPGTSARVQRVAVPLASLAVALCVLELLGPAAAPAFFSENGGLVERLFLGSVILWVGAVSALILTAGSKQIAAEPAGVPSP